MRFHPLRVTEVRRDTRDSVVVTLVPRAQDAQLFDFVQGQYLTFRRDFDGEELRRSYSICAPRGGGVMRVGIKRVDGGAFSSWANDGLAVGDELEAMPPAGRFHVPLDPAVGRRYLAFAVGSGITPIMSLIATTLEAEPKSSFSLVYGNRSISSIMFREELESLKNRYMARLSVTHVLGGDAQDIDLFSGRIDAHKCEQLFARWIDVEHIDVAFICGPEPMMQVVAASLREHGMDDEQIKYELFGSSQPGRAAQRVRSVDALEATARCSTTITLDGTTHIIDMPRQGQSVLEAALGASLDAPFACKAGVCSTCRARVLDGQAEMQKNHALEDHEVARGYVLTCQCYPLSDQLVLSYDQ